MSLAAVFNCYFEEKAWMDLFAQIPKIALNLPETPFCGIMAAKSGRILQIHSR